MHPAKSGTVTVSGKPGIEVPPGTLNSILKQARLKIVAMKYLVVVEKSDNGYGAYVPDLPGCVAAAKTRNEVVTLIQEAIEFHIEGLKQSGASVPMPTSQSELVDVHAA